jgi:hypothetical protein
MTPGENRRPGENKARLGGGGQANLFDRHSDTGFLTDKDRGDSDNGCRTVTGGSHGMTTGTRPSTNTYSIIVQYMLVIEEVEQETFITVVFLSPTPRHSESPRHVLTSGKKNTHKNDKTKLGKKPFATRVTNRFQHCWAHFLTGED